MVPAPHPLDFDWRFDGATTGALVGMVRDRRVLALGTPSIARALEAFGGSVLLVDRQPIHDVASHLIVDVAYYEVAPGSFDVAIIDPPWYSADLILWSTVAARAVGVGGSVLTSIWPSGSRPTAAAELSQTLASISRWASIETLPLALAYQIPDFEQVAASVPGAGPLSRSPRFGSLIEITPLERPPRPRPLEHRGEWLRFELDGYQLALRSDLPNEIVVHVDQHPEAYGWIWPFVSMRAPGLQEIGLWSSAGEVAIVSSPTTLTCILRHAFASSDANVFERRLAALPELLQWAIPRPPYRSYIEWRHPLWPSDSETAPPVSIRSQSTGIS